MSDDLMIEAEGLTKRYGDTVALAGIDLAVPAGSILGVLGPNGAGKTTAVRILTTLALPDSGRARVAGYDVVTEAAAVRRHIGVTAQDATLDELPHRAAEPGHGRRAERAAAGRAPRPGPSSCSTAST